MHIIAIISGITGQDGSYLVELLLSKEQYKKIYGITRRKSTENMERLSSEILSNERLHLRSLDLTDSFSIFNLLKEIKETVMKIIRSLYNISVAHLSFQHKCCINYLLIEYCFVYTM
jgi:GDPmannose 4,6-dehydratase